MQLDQLEIYQPRSEAKSVDVIENALLNYVGTCIWPNVFELTVTGWCIIVTYSVALYL